MNRNEALARLTEARSHWEDLVASLPRDRMEDVLWEGGWTAKSVVAHVDFYEWWAGELLKTRTMPIVDERLNVPDQDERNAALDQINQARPLHEVLSDSAGCHHHLIAALESMSDEDFADPSYVDFGFPGDWSPLHLTSSSSWDHYPAHMPDLQRISDAGR